MNKTNPNKKTIKFESSNSVPRNILWWGFTEYKQRNL